MTKRLTIRILFALTAALTINNAQAQVGEIGVATAAVLAARKQGDIRYKTLKTHVEMSEVVEGIYRMCRAFETLNDCHNKYSDKAIEQALISQKTVPSFTNPFGNPYVLRLGQKTLSTDLTRQESCKELAEEDWPFGVGDDMEGEMPTCQNGVLTLYLQD